MAACAGTYLVRTRDDPGKLPFLLILPFHDGFYDGRMVRSEVDETMSDAGLGGLAVLPGVELRGERLTSHIASKKAKDAVYTLRDWVSGSVAG